MDVIENDIMIMQNKNRVAPELEATVPKGFPPPPPPLSSAIKPLAIFSF